MQTILDMEPIETPSPKRPRGRAWRIVAVVLALHAVALGGFVVFQGCHRGEPAERSEESADVAAPAAPENVFPAPVAAPAEGQSAAVAQPGSLALTPEERMPGEVAPPAPPEPIVSTEGAPAEDAPAAPAAAKAVKPTGAVTHMVKSGETPALIAKKYGIAADALMRANGIVDATKLKVGQKLTVPSAKLKASAPTPRGTVASKAAAKPATRATHVVKSGETLTSIAKQHGVSVDALVKANKITDVSKLKIGQKLKLPSGRPSTGAPGASSDSRHSLRRLPA
ncbi:MAG: LysM peptidoglycan-binding domain-containing protein [Verrucomicrobiae bacterium]|nr:LysM peptidoglycan-binding domain-containing protein [Verrucomicrobiae bacterium]